MGESIFIEQLPPAPLDPATRWVAASLRRRTGAIVIDSLLVASIATVAMLPLVPDPFESGVGVWGDATSAASTGDLLMTALGYTVQAVVWVLYTALLTAREGVERGQTPGKQILRIRVLRSDGEAITNETAWLRASWFVLATSTTGILGILGDAAFGTGPHLTNAGDFIAVAIGTAMLLSALASLFRQTFYDRRLSTIVVDATPAGPPRPPGNTEPLRVDPRPRTWSTWVLAAAALVVAGALAASSLWPQLLA